MKVKKQISSKQRTETTLPPLNLLGFLRWSWRQLTSMNTALLLLLFVALAAIPGSILPQKTASLLRVNNWKKDNPVTAQLFESLGLFDVYGSFWFSAIYILLMISIIGCVIPRLKIYWNKYNETPPIPPTDLTKIASYKKVKVNVTTLDEFEVYFKKKGWRINRNDNSLTAEKGYLKEAGNLLFHASLIMLTAALAFGALFSYRGTVIVKEGSGFANTITQYDDFRAGKFFTTDNMPNFFFKLNDFLVEFETGINQTGSPREFSADISLNNNQSKQIEVNKPLIIDGTKIFLTGHGYAPKITIRDASNKIIFSDSVIFLPQDGNFSSTGVVKIPDVTPQIGIEARFLPTAFVDPVQGPISTFPGLNNPQLFMSLWSGDLGVNSGSSQSIYRLITTKMRDIGLEELSVGQSWNADNGYQITFDKVNQFASFQIAYEPGRFVALLAAILAMVGMILGLGLQRRRVWVNMQDSRSETNLVEIAGLAKNQTHDINKDIDKILTGFGVKGFKKVDRKI
jgi:cytochrome c biogenesis protein